MIECPNCHDANSCGDYEGPTCDVCNGTGRRATPADTSASVVGDREAAIEECAKVLDSAAQDWHRIRDPGMANNAKSYAKQIRALALPSAHREYDPNVAPCDDAEFGMKP